MSRSTTEPRRSPSKVIIIVLVVIYGVIRRERRWHKVPAGGRLRKALQAYKNSENYGDFAILKSDLLGAKVNPTVEAKLQHVVGYHPQINLEELSKYPHLLELVEPRPLLPVRGGIPNVQVYCHAE